ITDPYERQAPSTGDFVSEVSNRIAAQLPGLRETYPVRQDRSGAPVPNPYQGAGIVAPRTRLADPMIQTLDSYGVTLPAAVKTASTPNGKTLSLTASESQQAQQIAGQVMRQRIAALQANPNFQSSSWDAQG